MSENENMDFVPPIPVTEGWSQMQMLLDEHMPAQPAKRPLTYLWFAAALLGLLLAAIPLKETIQRNATLLPALQHTTTAAYTSYTDTLPAADAAAVYEKIIPSSTAVALHEPMSMPQDKISITHDSRDADLPADTIADLMEKKDSIIAIAAVQQEKDEHVEENKPVVKNAVAKKAKWSILAGASVNMVTSEKTKNFQPYPSIEVRYAIGNRLFVAGGLSVLSPVTTSTTAVEKSYFINDTLNNLKLYNENIVYRRFHYMDIPLTIGMNVTKKLSLSAGMQASVLLFSSTYNKSESYDFQMNRVETRPLNMFAPAAVVEPYVIENRKIEYRYIVGISYQAGRFAINASYQHALAPAVTGEQIQTKKNELFTAGLKYRIK